MKENGKRMYGQEWGLRNLRMGTCIKESSCMGKHMEMENTHGQTERFLKVSG